MENEQHFTDWLARNPAALARKLGSRLRLDDTKFRVGRFTPDLVFLQGDDAHAPRVVVENQLGRSDHDHLGKLITYISGIEGAHAGVWLAERFARPHLAAIDRLSAVGFARLHCLSFRPTAAGYSLVDPQIEVRRATPAEGYVWNEEDQTFWNDFIDFADTAEGALGDLQVCTPKETAGVWLNLSHSSVKLKGVTRRRKPDRGLWVELLLRDDHARHFGAIRRRDGELRRALRDSGERLEYRETNVNEPRLGIRREYSDLLDDAESAGHFSWLAANLELFRRTLGPVIAELER